MLRQQTEKGGQAARFRCGTYYLLKLPSPNGHQRSAKVIIHDDYRHRSRIVVVVASSSRRPLIHVSSLAVVDATSSVVVLTSVATYNICAEVYVLRLKFSICKFGGSAKLFLIMIKTNFIILFLSPSWARVALCNNTFFPSLINRRP